MGLTSFGSLIFVWLLKLYNKGSPFLYFQKLFYTIKNYYYYQKNVFGDIIGIYDSNKQVVAKYKYDPYGVCSITYDRYGAGNNNPFRYRGYYYDIETQIFYCNS